MQQGFWSKPIPLEQRNRKFFGLRPHAHHKDGWSKMINGRSTWPLSMLSGTLTSDAIVPQILPNTLKDQNQTNIVYSLFEYDRELLSLAARIFAPFSSDNQNDTTTHQHISKDLLMDNFRPRLDPNFQHELGHLRVQEGKVKILDESKANWWYKFEIERRDNLISQLESSVQRFKLPDFEFALVNHFSRGSDLLLGSS